MRVRGAERKRREQAERDLAAHRGKPYVPPVGERESVPERSPIRDEPPPLWTPAEQEAWRACRRPRVSVDPVEAMRIGLAQLRAMLGEEKEP